MKPIICDVFSIRDLNIEGLPTFSGNLYVAGNLLLADTSIPLEDFDDTYAPVELFGDVFVDGILSGDKIIIHGNLTCDALYCNSVTVDGNINVSRHATAIDTLHSTGGNIHLGSSDVTNIIASEGSIYIEEDLLAYSIKSFGSIFVGRNFYEANEIIAGDAVTINGYVETSDTRINFQVLSGGFGKHAQHN